VVHRATSGHTTRAATRDVGQRATGGYITRAATRDVGHRATSGPATRVAMRDVWTPRDDRPYHPGRHARRVDTARRSAISPGPPCATSGQRATIGHITRAAMREVCDNTPRV
ncbi:MAG: hypothetical protein ACK5Q2_09990, partial [Bacteroidota bacterium]